MKSVLISTYKLGHQPFGLASSAAWLQRAGCDVTCLDLSCQTLDEETLRSAELIGMMGKISYLEAAEASTSHRRVVLASTPLPAIRRG